MPNDYFHLAATIVEADKYFDISLAEIERELVSSGKFSHDTELVVDDNGDETAVNISIRLSWSTNPSSWSVAVLLHQKRIDCIDHEHKFCDIHGNLRSGWHRHTWDENLSSCEQQKVAIADLDGIQDIQRFLTIAFNLMRVTLNRNDYGSNELFIN